MERMLVAAVVAALIGVAPAGQAARPLAHKGVHNASYDENTLRSLERAHELGVYVETDVNLTGDGRAMVIHDGRLDRTTNCTGEVAAWTAQAIRERCRTDGQNAVVPTLNEYLRKLSNNPGQVLNVELKGGGWIADDNAQIKMLRDLTVRHGVLDRTFYSAAGAPRPLMEFRDSTPEVRTAWKPRRTDTVTIAEATELSVDVVMAKRYQWTRVKVRRFERHGFKAWAQLTNNIEEWLRLARWGVNAILTDRPVTMNRAQSA